MLWTLTIGSLNFFKNINMTNLNWTAVNIWKSYKDMNMKAIFAHFLTHLTHFLSSSEKKGWKKKSGLHRIWTYDLCDTGAVLYQLS